MDREHRPTIDIGDLQRAPIGCSSTHSRRDENVFQIWTRSALADVAARVGAILPRPLRENQRPLRLFTDPSGRNSLRGMAFHRI
jgi:hypothetical protein